MGISESQWEDRFNTIVSKLEDATLKMVKEEELNAEKLETQCSKHKSNIMTLWTELECEGDVDFEVEDAEEDITLLQKEKCMRDQLELLRNEKQKRLISERVLINEDKELSAFLGVEAVETEENQLLTEDEKIKLENHIGEMKRVREERENFLFTMKEEILRLLDELEIDLNTTSLAAFIADEARV